MVFLADDELRILDVNARTCEVLGYSREELLSRRIPDIRDPSTPFDHESHLHPLVRTGLLQFRTRYRRKDGTTFPVEVHVHVERAGERPLFHGIVHDISERQRAEEALRASEARFRAAFDGATIGMVLLDGDGRVVEMNRAMQTMVGYGEESLGTTSQDYVHPDEREAAREEFRRLRTGRIREIDGYRRYCRKDGSILDARLRVRALTDGDGAFQYALGMVEDITDRRRMEAQLRLADRMASVGTLAAGVAHEINNPLAFVLANLEYAIRELSRDGRLPDVVAALEEAREGGTRVREIVRDLKTFSRPDDTTREPLDVGRVLRSALSLAGAELSARAQLEVDLLPTPPVLASEHRLGQVFLNLLINASQAIPEGHPGEHRVRVSSGVHYDGRIRVEVKDDGAGIPPEIRSRIFDPFFTTKPVGVGTGLGLSICHGIVVALGGEITVDSTVGSGSTFRVFLPAAPTEQQPRPTPVSSTPSRRARVMVVDDEPLVCRAVQRILSPPHEVHASGSGRDALEALRADPTYDLVLCDLMMPEMSGMDLHEAVARRAPELAARFVFFTGGAFTAGARDFLSRVGNERVEKPFEPAALRELVIRLLRSAPSP